MCSIRSELTTNGFWLMRVRRIIPLSYRLGTTPSDLKSPRAVPISILVDARNLSLAWIASLLLEAVDSRDFHSMELLRREVRVLELSRAGLDPATAERVELLSALAHAPQPRRDLLHHLARPLLVSEGSRRQ